MTSRKVAKKIVQFAKRQWKDTKPKTVEIRRVNDEKVMEFGFPPTVIKANAPIKFLVCVEYTNTLRVYRFSNDGQLLGAENIARPFEIQSEIAKKSKLIYKIPTVRSN